MDDSPTVLYEDDALLVVSKPSGLPSQSTRSGGPNLFDQLRSRYSYVGLHHRLDRPASGLLLFTLDTAANKPIAEAFRAHRIEREYAAVLTGMAEDGSWTRRLDGKRAVTHLSVIGHGHGLTAAHLRLETGRMHQIRRHAAMAGLPLAGDRRYGADDCRRWPRLALHAQRLSFSHPMNGKRIDVEAPLPSSLASLWAEAISG